MTNIFDNISLFSHELIKKVIDADDIVVDATAGNGNDTIFLAKNINDSGKVYAFDIQKEALDNTKEKLQKEKLIEKVILINSGHENMGEYINDRVGCVMFNLGFLPGGDHTLVTKPDTTLKALQESLDLLKLNGIITIAIYTGHEGGEDEKNLLEEFLSKLNTKIFTVLKWTILNKSPKTPYLIAIYKREEIR